MIEALGYCTKVALSISSEYGMVGTYRLLGSLLPDNRFTRQTLMTLLSGHYR